MAKQGKFENTVPFVILQIVVQWSTFTVLVGCVLCVR